MGCSYGNIMMENVVLYSGRIYHIMMGIIAEASKRRDVVLDETQVKVPRELENK